MGKLFARARDGFGSGGGVMRNSEAETPGVDAHCLSLSPCPPEQPQRAKGKSKTYRRVASGIAPLP